MVRASGDARRGSTSKPMRRPLKVRHTVAAKNSVVNEKAYVSRCVGGERTRGSESWVTLATSLPSTFFRFVIHLRLQRAHPSLRLLLLLLPRAAAVAATATLPKQALLLLTCDAMIQHARLRVAHNVHHQLLTDGSSRPCCHATVPQIVADGIGRVHVIQRVVGGRGEGVCADELEGGARHVRRG